MFDIVGAMEAAVGDDVVAVVDEFGMMENSVAGRLCSLEDLTLKNYSLVTKRDRDCLLNSLDYVLYYVELHHFHCH